MDKFWTGAVAFFCGLVLMFLTVAGDRSTSLSNCDAQVENYRSMIVDSLKIEGLKEKQPASTALEGKE